MFPRSCCLAEADLRTNSSDSWKSIRLMFNRIKSSALTVPSNVEVKQEGGLNQPRSSLVSADASAGRCLQRVVSAARLFIRHVMFARHGAAHRWLTLKRRVRPDQLTSFWGFLFFFLVVFFVVVFFFFVFFFFLFFFFFFFFCLSQCSCCCFCFVSR